MRKMDAHLLLLCTNQVLNLRFSNLNHLNRFLLSLAHQMCFLAEQIGKRAELDEQGMYLYTPLQNPTVTV
jgi:hypothetical protein